MVLNSFNVFTIMSVCFLINVYTVRVNAEEAKSFSDINYKAACRNFDLTKEKLNAILRAHACKNADYAECEQQLGLGKMGLVSLGAGAMEAAALRVHSKIRNPNFVMCAVSQTPIFHFQLGPFWPSIAYAKCYDPLIAFRDQLRIDMQENAREIDELIKEQRKEISINDKDKKIIDLSTEKAKEGLEELKSKSNETAAKLKEIFSEISDSSTENEKNTEKVNKLLTELKGLRESAVAKDKESYRKLYSNLLGKAVIDNQISPDQAQKISGLLSTEYSTMKKEIPYRQKLNLEDLKKKKEKFLQFANDFTANPDLSPFKRTELSSQNLAWTIYQLSESQTITGRFKERLDYYSRWMTTNYGQNHVQIDTLKVPLNIRTSEAFKNLKTVYTVRDLLNPGRAVAKGVISIVLSTGFISATNAAGLNKDVEQLDPFNLKPAGECSDMISRIARDPNNDCQLISEVNDDFYKKYSDADDEVLKDLFGSYEGCNFIQNIYEKNYPKVKSQNLNCSSPKPWSVEFENKTKLVIQNDRVELSGAELTGTLQYDLNAPKTAKPFVIKEYGEIFRVANQWNSNILPDYRRAWQQMKVAAIEIASCCSDGVTPSESECARYGIKAKNSDAAAEKASEAGQK